MRKTIVVVSLLALAGCQSSPPSPAPSVTPPALPSVEATASSSAALAARPLRFPVIAPGGDCPITPRRPWSGPNQASAVLGEGPVYPVGDYFREGTTLELRPDDREPDGSYVKKVRWIGEGYTGPVLVRAGRVDAAGTASVKFSYWGQARDGGYYADLPRESTDLPATTTVTGPGCFAYQVDGRDFTTVIVFRAVPV